MIIKRYPAVFMAVCITIGLLQAQDLSDKQPVIDVHLHATPLRQLQNSVHTPLPYKGIETPKTVEDHIQQTLQMMDDYNVVLGFVTGFDPENVKRYRDADPVRIKTGIQFGTAEWDPDMLRSKFESGEFEIMGELTMQYAGKTPSDSDLDSYFALAESMDLPVCIHTGFSFPGITRVAPNFRMSLGNPLVMEELLNKHPNLRVWLAHAGWPFLEEIKAILHTYPQVYIDISTINWLLPRDEFYYYLEALIRAGYGKRIMYGSDQMSWPEGIKYSIETIRAADFLSEQQKQDIFYNNAARFFRLTKDDIEKHHTKKTNN